MVLSVRLPAASGKRLKRLASQHGWSASDTTARLVEEGLRRGEFAFIDFRDSPTGRQTYVQGSSLPVWEVMLVARSHKNNAAATAAHLHWPVAKVQSAFNYAKAFPKEIDDAIADYDATSFENLSRLLPQARELRVSSPAKSR